MLIEHVPYAALNRLQQEIAQSLATLQLQRFSYPTLAEPLKTTQDVVAALARDKHLIASYDVELQDFIDAAAQGTASGPTSWDGYVAAISSDACVAAQEAPGMIVPITLPARPALYA